MAVKPLALRKLEKQSKNIYEAVVVMSKRARQINQERYEEKVINETDDISELDVLMIVLLLSKRKSESLKFINTRTRLFSLSLTNESIPDDDSIATIESDFIQVSIFLRWIMLR